MIDGTSGDGAGGEERAVLTAGAVAQAVGGTLRGDPDLPLTGLAPLDRAARSDISFLAAPKYAPLAARTGAGLVLVSPELAEVPCAAPATVVVARPHEAVLALIPRFHREVPPPAGVHPSAQLGRGVTVGARVSVGPNAVLGDGVTLGDGVVVGANATIGDGVPVGEGSRIYPNVTVYAGSVIGRRVFIHAGARVGSDGFGYVYRDGAHRKIPHVGRCIIEDDVEIGANTTIDRGSIDDTVIGAGTKLDNLVQVGHNVRVGRLCLIVAQAGIAGSVRIEDGAVIGGQVGLAGHLTIGKGAKVAAQAGVFGDVPPGETWSGYPARPHREALRAQAALFKLPSLLRRIERLLEGKDGPT